MKNKGSADEMAIIGEEQMGQMFAKPESRNAINPHRKQGQ